MAFQCTIVTPERQLLDEQITQAIIPGFDGMLGVLTGRSPLLMKLGIGTLRVDRSGGQQTRYFVDGGIAQMKDNKLTILTTRAIPASEIDGESARAEYAEAEARRPTDPATASERQKQMARAKAKQKLAGQR